MAVARQALKIHLVAASNLKAADFASNSSDPFVRVYWQGDQNSRDVIESRVENNTVNPIWNQDLHIEWKPERKTLIIDVYDKDITSDDYLGRAVIPIENMMASNTSYYLKPRVGMGDTDITGYLVLRFQMPDSAGQATLFRTLTRATSANGLSNIANSHLDAIDSSLSNYPIFQVLEEKTGVPRAKLVAASVMFLLFFIVFGYGSRAACLLIGALYPVYASFKAVKSVGKEDDAQWLMYWIVYGLFLVLESFADVLLFWIPFYYFFKFLILLWLMHPETRGAGQIYLFIIAPMLNRYSSTADKYLAGAVGGGPAYGGGYAPSQQQQFYGAPSTQHYNNGPAAYQSGASNAGNVVRF